MQLSDHFTLSELTKSDTAIRYGIANEPGDTEIDNLLMLCNQVLEPVDFEVPGIPNKELALWVKDNCAFDQLILEFYKEGIPDSGWVHCSYTIDRENRKSARIFDGKNWSSLDG